MALAVSAVLVLSFVWVVQMPTTNEVYAQENSRPSVTGRCLDEQAFDVSVHFTYENLNPDAFYYVQILNNAHPDAGYESDVVYVNVFPGAGQEERVEMWSIPKFWYLPGEPITLNLYEDRDGDIDRNTVSNVEPEELVATTSVICGESPPPFPNPPPSPIITDASCSPIDESHVFISIKIENLDVDGAYEYTLVNSITGEVVSQSFLQYQQGDPIEYTGSESPLEYPIAFYTKQLEFEATSDVPNNEVFVFTIYSPNVGGQVVTSAILCDTTPPLLTVPNGKTAQATAANGGTVVTYTVTAQDNVDGTGTLREDDTLAQDDVGGDISIECDPPSGSEFQIGETSVTCMAWDAAGNGRDASFTVTVNPPPPPPDPVTVDVSSSTTVGVAPLSVDFSATVTGGTPPYSYNWDFGDGTIEEESSESTTSHTYVEPGPYTVTVTVTDANGQQDSDSLQVTVNEPPPPEPEIPDPAEATEELISDIQNLQDVSQSTKTSLTAPLREVLNILNDDNPNNDNSACGRFGAFINQVNAAERRGSLTEVQADDLRTQAEDIREMLGC